MGYDTRMIRVGVRDPGLLPDVPQRDEWLSRQGDVVQFKVPGAGVVTLALSGGWSAGGTAFCHLAWEDEESADLARRQERRDRILALVADLDAPDAVLAPIRDFANGLVPEAP